MPASPGDGDGGSGAASLAESEPGEFGLLLRGHRLRAGLSQQLLAQRAALSTAAISALERGHRTHPHPGTASRLAGVLGLDSEERAHFLAVAAGPVACARPDGGRGVSVSAANAHAALPPMNRRVATPLPRQLTSFVGRQAELDDLGRVLGTARLVTLVGPGGIGKTRLALEAAAAASERYRDGVAFVDLAPLVEPALLPEAAMAALSVRQRVGLAPAAVLAEALRELRLLLLLDNCEHVVDVAAALVRDLLHSCRELTALATSRQPLGVPGEVVWRVPSLPLPDALPLAQAQVLESPAVRLFAERAAAALPSFALTDATAEAVADICRRLDGIPLAIELAATRVRVLGVDQIRHRLDDRFELLVGKERLVPERQQTLRATLDWSYGLLSAAERGLFRQLAVFAGSWSLEAVEAICAGPDLSSAELLRLLSNLVDHSLVVADLGEQGLVARYRLLDTMRHYAADRLAEAGEARAARDRHLDWYLTQAERVPLQRFDEGHIGWLAAEYDNLRAALRWSIDSGRLDAGLRLAVACAAYWQVRGSTAEGRRWLTELIQRGATELDSPAAASALNTASQLALVEWDLDAAHALVQRCVTLAERLGDRAVLGYAHMRRGIILARARSDLRGAQAELEEALRLGRELADSYLEIYCLYSLGLTLYSLGDHAQAEEFGRRLLALAESLDHRWGSIRGHRVLGRVALARRELDSAARHFEASLAQSRALADLVGMVGALLDLGQLALAQAAPLRAQAAFAEGLRLAHRLGDKLEVARALEGLAGLAVPTLPERAVQLLAAAEAVRALLGAEPYPDERPTLVRWRKSARARLSERAYLEAERTGASAPLDSMIGMALDLQAALPAPANGSLRQPESADVRHLADLLTPRERQVAGLVGQGLSTRAIAERLVVTEGTAKIHVYRVLAKLELHSRAALAAWAVRHGLADAETLAQTPDASR